MKLANVSGIDFEAKVGSWASEQDEVIKFLRCPNPNPLNFNQKLIKDIIGDLLDKPNIKILEIGCGWGRNAQFFKDMQNVNYFAFDTSPTSLELFRKQGFSEDRFYTSLDIDDTILSQEYDLIFSTYVLQHIGYPDSTAGMNANEILDKVCPTLKSDGCMFFHELWQGQNNWQPFRLIQHLNTKDFNASTLGSVKLDGGDGDAHDLICVRSMRDWK
jgi:cyclopropane fatty-acyl-phospholipid synthase-like methyltransferase